MNNKLSIKNIIAKYDLTTSEKIITFLKDNANKYDFYILSKIAEHANSSRIQNSAYYTDEELIEYIIKDCPNFDNKDEIKIIEPSVGVGNFLPFLFRKYKDKNIVIDVVDIDSDSLKILKTLLGILGIPKNVKINFIDSDFCEFVPLNHYDLAIGNPPFSKINNGKSKKFNNEYFYNLKSTNLSSYFYEKCAKISDYVCMVMPKNLLNTNDYSLTRQYLSNFNVETIIDFGEKGFKGVLIETIYVKTCTFKKPTNTKVISVPTNTKYVQKQKYIFDTELPYWIIYRNAFFDEILNKMEFDIFKVFRDRQITNKIVTKKKQTIRVLKSRNISDDGQQIIDIKGYDDYISESNAKPLETTKFLNRNDVFLTPNMTYNTRVMRKKEGTVTNGSIAILIPKKDINISNEDLVYFSSKEYRAFMKIARNFQTRTLNVDQTSVYFYGIRKSEAQL